MEHDGSSESCGLRNPLQECHVRVLLERVEEGDVIEQQELHDSTFRANELLIPFDLGAVDLDPGQTRFVSVSKRTNSGIGTSLEQPGSWPLQ